MTEKCEMDKLTEHGAAEVAAGLDTLGAAADVADVGALLRWPCSWPCLCSAGR